MIASSDFTALHTFIARHGYQSWTYVTAGLATIEISIPAVETQADGSTTIVEEIVRCAATFPAVRVALGY